MSKVFPGALLEVCFILSSPQSEIHYGEECPLNYTRLYPGGTPEKVNNKPLRLGKWRGKNYEIKQSKEMV